MCAHRPLSVTGTRPRHVRRVRNLPLKVCLLSYRGNPASGGQGVYIRRISRALADLGHSVDVVSGPPYPHLDPDITLHKLPGLDLYNPDALFRKPSLKELTSPINTLEWISAASGGFPEPLAFSLRALAFMHRNGHRYDVIHDNQCLAYGLLGIQSMVPTVATIHHPITKDRDISIRAASSFSKKISIRRWYHFLSMQKRVSRRITNLITVSETSRADISKDFAIDDRRFHVVANGINTEIFHPIAGVRRPENRLIVTNSADTPLKGLRFLMLAMAELRRNRDVHLTVIGKPKSGGVIERLVGELGLTSAVTFTGRIDERDFARYYAESAVAVVPSLYEGFGLPAGEAMACGVPVVSTTGGALPEVVGEAGVLVPPGDAFALAAAIADLLASPDKRQDLGRAGYERVIRNFTWLRCAQKTTEVYAKAIEAHAN